MRFIIVIVLWALCGCGDSTPRIRLGTPARIKVYMNESVDEIRCDGKSTPGILVSETIDDFETEGFAKVQVDHIPADRKVFFIVTATDAQSGQILGYGCTDIFEVGRNSAHDIHLVLNPESVPQ